MYCLVAFVTLEVFTPTTISIFLYSPENWKNEGGGREGEGEEASTH